MKTFAKLILVAIAIAVAFNIVMNVIFFFPWYMTLTYETYNLTQIAASDNYIKKIYYDSISDGIKDRAIFNKYPGEITIVATNAEGRSAISTESKTDAEYAALTDATQKPYCQRGNEIEVSISAVYPLTIRVGGVDVIQKIPVTVNLTTIGLKHYKDLDYYTDF